MITQPSAGRQVTRLVIALPRTYRLRKVSQLSATQQVGILEYCFSKAVTIGQRAQRKHKNSKGADIV